jgi:hypothetical protein
MATLSDKTTEAVISRAMLKMITDVEDRNKKDTAQIAKVLKTVAEFARETRDHTIQETERLEGLFMEAVERLENKNTSDIQKAVNDLKVELQNAIAPIEQKLGQALDEQQKGMNFIHDKVAKLQHGQDGKDSDPEEIAKLVLEKLPEPEKPIDNTEVIDKLTKEVDELKQRPIGRIGMKKITSVRTIDLSSQLNGSLKTFTLPADTLKVLGVWGTQFPITFRADVDWTFSGRTLTLTGEVSAPASGQTLHALVETAFYS